MESVTEFTVADPGFDSMIRIDEIWLSTQPMDMRAGMDTSHWLRC
ncbi:hypothetical protein N0Z73_19305 [Acinetobacter baumannii]|nr:hypothetical protein [Acinetobacter baumannii]MDG5658883.1 hypothetical protein [Acinetobacter baumannii]MDQ8773729.1 hypothetical protein [Acinetobacter baumannii]